MFSAGHATADNAGPPLPAVRAGLVAAGLAAQPFDIMGAHGALEWRVALDTSQALNRFLAGVEKRAFRMAQIATGNRDDALDIVQDAMLKLAQRYANRGAEEWGPLFHTILTSRINDFHRRNAVRNRFRVFLRRPADPDDDGEDLIDRAPGHAGDEPDRRLDGSRSMAALYQALRALPARQQQAFLLRTWEGYGVAETAKVMGCSEGSVKTHYSRAVHTLRDKLGSDWQ